MASGKVYPASGKGVADVAWHADRKYAVVRLSTGEQWRVTCQSAKEARYLGSMDAHEFTRWCDLKNQQLYPEKIARKLGSQSVHAIGDELDFNFAGY